ncbi:MAG: hypothetical protein JRN53_05765 [Nitrososphaerota archaeon]|nr:hypothetical protein [Nitrososphaerota archaeon]
MSNREMMYINGVWRDGDGVQSKVISPVDGTVLGKFVRQALILLRRPVKHHMKPPRNGSILIIRKGPSYSTV